MHLLSHVKQFWNRIRAAVFHFLVMICLFNYKKQSGSDCGTEKKKTTNFFYRKALEKATVYDFMMLTV